VAYYIIKKVRVKDRAFYFIFKVKEMWVELAGEVDSSVLRKYCHAPLKYIVDPKCVDNADNRKHINVFYAEREFTKVAEGLVRYCYGGRGYPKHDLETRLSILSLLYEAPAIEELRELSPSFPKSVAFTFCGVLGDRRLYLDSSALYLYRDMFCFYSSYMAVDFFCSSYDPVKVDVDRVAAMKPAHAWLVWRAAELVDKNRDALEMQAPADKIEQVIRVCRHILFLYEMVGAQSP